VVAGLNDERGIRLGSWGWRLPRQQGWTLVIMFRWARGGKSAEQKKDADSLCLERLNAGRHLAVVTWQIQVAPPARLRFSIFTAVVPLA
jgi:hypothetical protein